MRSNHSDNRTSHRRARSAASMRRIASWVCIGFAVVLTTELAGAQDLATQCHGDLQGEIEALEAVGASIYSSVTAATTTPGTKVGAADSSSTPRNGEKIKAAQDSAKRMAADTQKMVSAKPSRDTTPTKESALYTQAVKELSRGKAFVTGLEKGGAAVGCVLLQQQAYNTAVRNSLNEDPATVDSTKLRNALRDGMGAVLSTRYAPTDRVGVIFGFGMSYLFNPADAGTFKVVNGRDSAGTTQQYIVQENDDRLIPSALTGIGVRFRDGNRFVPTTVFGSVQFSPNSGSLVSGTALGLGWTVIGDVALLVGFSLQRTKTLREDLRHQRDSLGKVNARQPVPPGETAESIMGTATSGALLLSLAVPVSLKSVFGGP